MKEEPTREVREEHRRMKKRVEKLLQSTMHSPPRRQPWSIRSELEVLRANIASLERRYRFD